MFLDDHLSDIEYKGEKKESKYVERPFHGDTYFLP